MFSCNQDAGVQECDPYRLLGARRNKARSVLVQPGYNNLYKAVRQVIPGLFLLRQMRKSFFLSTHTSLQALFFS